MFRNAPPQQKIGDENPTGGLLNIEGAWVLVRGDGKIRISVELIKGDEKLYEMKGTGNLVGEYTWDKRKLTKVRKPGDNYSDIVWVRRGGAFLNKGSDYTDWEMVRPEPEEEGEEE